MTAAIGEIVSLFIGFWAPSGVQVAYVWHHEVFRNPISLLKHAIEHGVTCCSQPIQKSKLTSNCHVNKPGVYG